MKLGSYLKFCREQKGLSQKDVCDQLGYKTSQFMCNNERGVSKPSFSQVKRLCDIIGADRKIVYQLMMELDIDKIKKKYRGKVGVYHYTA